MTNHEHLPVTPAIAATVQSLGRRNVLYAKQQYRPTGIFGDADDLVQGDPGSDELYGEAGNDILLGGTGDDTLMGEGGNSTAATSDDDWMGGGDGNDTHNVDDLVIEALNAGTDTVFSTIATYTLTDNVENLSLNLGTDQDGAGNALDNLVSGNEGINVLAGDEGSDTLYVLGGNDTLDGGSGADVLDGRVGNDTFMTNQGSRRHEIAAVAAHYECRIPHAPRSRQSTLGQEIGGTSYRLRWHLETSISALCHET